MFLGLAMCFVPEAPCRADVSSRSEPTGLHRSTDHLSGFLLCGLQRHGGIERAVDGGDESFADELVQFEVVDVAAVADLGGVDDEETWSG